MIQFTKTPSEQLNIYTALWFCFLLDRSGHWTRTVLIIQRGLGVLIFRGMATLLRRAGLQMGYVINTTGIIGTTAATLQGTCDNKSTVSRNNEAIIKEQRRDYNFVIMFLACRDRWRRV